jgi:hypothetical protein
VRTLGLGVALVAGLALAGCNALQAPDSNSSPALSQSSDRDGTTFVFDPWELEGNVAFLCLAAPGQAFSGPGSVPPPEAGCTRLTTITDGRSLRARFAIAALAPDLAPRFAGSHGPWYLAVSGFRGSATQALVTEIDNSPIPSDPGPS